MTWLEALEASGIHEHPEEFARYDAAFRQTIANDDACGDSDVTITCDKCPFAKANISMGACYGANRLARWSAWQEYSETVVCGQKPLLEEDCHAR